MVKAMSPDELVTQLISVGKRLNKTPSRSEFVRETGISLHQVSKHFDTWTDFVRAGNLEPNNKTRIEDEDLFRAMHDAFIKAGCIPTTTKFDRLCRYSYAVYKRRGWGGWNSILLLFRQWASVNAPDFPSMSDLPTSVAKPVIEENASVTPARGESAVWSSTGGRLYGSFLNFRGLLHAPINEQGVVFLFGMVAHELGYVVESVTPGFPDCEAKRRVSKSAGTWERVRIEFEFQSRNFLTHGHDPSACHVIVCWEDNWPKCPIEVLELKSAIQNLED
jgi:hypothetical protein